MRTPNGFRFGVPLFFLIFIGCGQGIDPAQDVTEQASYILAGATNVTDTRLPGSTSEQETSSASVGNEVVITYNRNDPGHLASGSRICAGYSAQALAYAMTSALGSWTNQALPMPGGITILGGDPSVAGIVDGSNLRFYISGMAISTSKWQSLHPDGSNCIPLSTFVAAGNDKICTWEVDFLNGSTTPTVSNQPCVGPQSPSDVVDGSSIRWYNSQALPYIAYRNQTQFTAEVFQVRSNQPPAQLPPVPIVGVSHHALFVRETSSVQIVTMGIINNTNVIALTQWNGSAWSAPVQLASGWNDGDVTLANGTSIRDSAHNFMAVEYGGLPQPPQLYLFFRTVTSGKSRFQGVSCTENPWNCAQVSAWTTGTTNHSFLGSLAISHKFTPGNPFPTVTPTLSFVQENSPGNVTLKWGQINPDLSFTVSDADGGISEVPCPAQDYWGDYDDLAVIGESSTAPQLMRPFTDSSDGSCVATGGPMHVSMLHKFVP